MPGPCIRAPVWGRGCAGCPSLSGGQLGLTKFVKWPWTRKRLTHFEKPNKGIKI